MTGLKWMKLSKQKSKTSKAQALVELALILPALIIAIAVIVELGRLFHAWLAVENGARFGIRYAVTGEYNPANCAGGAIDGKCIYPADEVAARVDSIHDVARGGSTTIMRKGEGEANNTEPGYFHVLVCKAENLIPPESTFDSYACDPTEDPGAVEYNGSKLAAPLFHPFAQGSQEIIVDATSSGRYSHDISHPHATGTGENRLMLVGISVSDWPDTPSVLSATYGGQALTLAGSTFIEGEGVFIYYLINPPSGTANVDIDYASGIQYSSVVGVMTFTGVDQSTPLGAFAGATGTGTSASVVVSSASGELVFDTVMNAYDKVITVGGNQTSRWNDKGDPTGGGSTEAGATSVTMSWAWLFSNPWAIGAVSIKPAEEPTPTPTPTNTPTPTDTPTATFTPIPTSTNTPTNTPVPPTATSTPTNTPIPTALPSGDDPGEPGERIVVITEFNHPLILPFLSSVWPQLRLTSMREAIVETYYVPPVVGTPPPYDSPTPRPTNTPGPTPTPPPATTSTPTMTLDDPRCDLIWISGMTGNETSRYIRFEIRAYDWDEWPQVVNYHVIVNQVEVWQDEEAGPWVIEGFTWETWDENGTYYQRYDEYDGPEWWLSTFYPDPVFEFKHCLGADECGGANGYQYRGRITIHFGQDLLGEYAIFPWVVFPDYDVSCREWAPWVSQGWETDTPPGGSPGPTTDTPIPPTELPPTSTGGPPPPTQGTPEAPPD